MNGSIPPPGYGQSSRFTLSSSYATNSGVPASPQPSASAVPGPRAPFPPPSGPLYLPQNPAPPAGRSPITFPALALSPSRTRPRQGVLPVSPPGSASSGNASHSQHAGEPYNGDNSPDSGSLLVLPTPVTFIGGRLQSSASAEAKPGGMLHLVDSGSSQELLTRSPEAFLRAAPAGKEPVQRQSPVPALRPTVSPYAVLGTAAVAPSASPALSKQLIQAGVAPVAWAPSAVQFHRFLTPSVAPAEPAKAKKTRLIAGNIHGLIFMRPSLAPLESSPSPPCPFPVPLAPKPQPPAADLAVLEAGTSDFDSQTSVFTYTPLKRALNGASLLCAHDDNLVVLQSCPSASGTLQLMPVNSQDAAPYPMH